MTSNLSVRAGILVTPTDLEQGTLSVNSLVLPDKIYTLSRQIIIKRFGRLSEALFDRVLAEIDRLFGK